MAKSHDKSKDEPATTAKQPAAEDDVSILGWILTSRFGMAILFALYFAVFLMFSRSESALTAVLTNSGNASEKPIDTKFSFSAQELAQFLNKIGVDGRAAYAYYLAMEAPLAIIGSLLVALAVHAVDRSLASAEQALDERIAQKEAEVGQSASNNAAGKAPHRVKREVQQARSALLSMVPYVVALVDLAENMMLVGIIIEFDALVAGTAKYSSIWQISAIADPVAWAAFVVPNVTLAKWALIRAGIALTVLTLATGWLRVVLHKAYSGQLLGTDAKRTKEAMAKVHSGIKGLTRMTDLKSAETFDSSSLPPGVRVQKRKQKLK